MIVDTIQPKMSRETKYVVVSEIVLGVISSLFRSDVVDSFREHAFAE